MTSAIIFLWTLVAVLGWQLYRRAPGEVADAARSALGQARGLVLRVPVTLVAAGMIGALVPPEVIALAIGASSGLAGIVLAALLGGIIPGGPMVSFPVAVVIMENGAGGPQMVALISGWSVFAFHRIIAFEAPLMGFRFVLVRVIASLPLPVLAGLMSMPFY